MRHLFDEIGCNCEQVIMPFQFKEPCDLTDNQVARRNSKALTEFQIVLCIEKRLEVEAAENPRVLAWCFNAGSEVLFNHRIRYRDKMRRYFSGISLSSAKSNISERTL